MLDEVYVMIRWQDDQAAIDQLREIADLTDGVPKPSSAEDWIVGSDAQLTNTELNTVIADYLSECNNCL
jgi:hypothetical protein